MLLKDMANNSTLTYMRCNNIYDFQWMDIQLTLSLR